MRVTLSRPLLVCIFFALASSWIRVLGRAHIFAKGPARIRLGHREIDVQLAQRTKAAPQLGTRECGTRMNIAYVDQALRGTSSYRRPYRVV